MTDADRPDGNRPDASGGDDNPSCLPGVLAATLIMMMIGFITCGFASYFLWQQRGVMAGRTLEGLAQEVGQSRIEPVERAAVVRRLERVAKDVSARDFDPAEAASIMQRLVRLPILQWGQLQAVEAMITERFSKSDADEAQLQIDRLKLAMEQLRATSADLRDVLTPVSVADPTAASAVRMVDRPTDEQLRDVAQRASLIADRAGVDADGRPTLRLSELIDREIRAAMTEGGF